jgi:hypothetical protein
MTKREPSAIIVALFFAFAVLFPTAAIAAGDRVIPQVADGTGSDGTKFRTRIDLTNLGPETATRITNTRVLFFLQSGLPWTVATNLGTGSSFKLDLGAFNTLRIETSGAGNLTAGYVIIRSSEPTTIFAEDYELNVSCYYEVSKGGSVIDTISVPVAKPTIVWVNPMQTDTGTNLLTGFAVVNLSNSANLITLRSYRAESPSGGAATEAGQATFTLGPNEQRARFLNESGLFPSLTSFRGMLLGTSEQPVALVALLQTPTPSGVQYATLEPTYADSLRRNTYTYLRQEYALDADLPVVDYFGNKDDSAPWDVLYQTVSTTSRRLVPQPGAAVAVLGIKTDPQFDDDVTIDVLRGLTYTTTPIDLSDNSPNLARQFAFAVRTGLGRYVKIRIADPIQRDTYRDLALEIYVYK